MDAPGQGCSGVFPTKRPKNDDSILANSLASGGRKVYKTRKNTGWLDPVVTGRV